MTTKDALHILDCAVSVLQDYAEDYYRWEDDEETRERIINEILDIRVDLKELRKVLRDGGMKLCL